MSEEAGDRLQSGIERTEDTGARAAWGVGKKTVQRTARKCWEKSAYTGYSEKTQNDTGSFPDRQSAEPPTGIYSSGVEQQREPGIQPEECVPVWDSGICCLYPGNHDAGEWRQRHRPHADCVELTGCESPFDLGRLQLSWQGYNGYIGWALTNYGGYSLENTLEFSQQQAVAHGWSGYGDPEYVPHVQRYYSGGNIFAGLFGNQQIVTIAQNEVGVSDGQKYWS